MDPERTIIKQCLENLPWVDDFLRQTEREIWSCILELFKKVHCIFCRNREKGNKGKPERSFLTCFPPLCVYAPFSFQKILLHFSTHLSFVFLLFSWLVKSIHKEANCPTTHQLAFSVISQMNCLKLCSCSREGHTPKSHFALPQVPSLALRKCASLCVTAGGGHVFDTKIPSLG